MELWIRSQDRTNLIKVERLYVSGTNDEYYIGDNLIGHIGTFNTKERALEVLDEIQNTIIKLSALSITGISNENIAKEYVKLFKEENITSLKVVYEMPKE